MSLAARVQKTVVDARGVETCRVHFPGFVTHVAVVVDSVVVEEALPLGGARGPLVVVRR